MRRGSIFIILFILAVVLAAATLYLGNEYWIHRYDDLILRHASVYRVEPKLVWSVIYEETYFRSTVVGDAEEVGLMQVTPTVAREWAKQTGLKEIEQKTSDNVREFISEPERNIQVGCWYLEQLGEKYRGLQAQTAMTLAAYNAGPSRVEEWLEGVDRETISEAEFIKRIKINSTRLYVSSILRRFRED
ncbi:MAG: lytic transglycosylase domain-containing protein [Acidobacteriota bacterium]|nr:lytic transglycosylase domain-containing protein [Acidobacteriota bacterium]MDH3528235.1 lytic transglycosylase domain-containing protein [Acidobacteriota bacterium]